MWPFETSKVATALINLLQTYPPQVWGSGTFLAVSHSLAFRPLAVFSLLVPSLTRP